MARPTIVVIGAGPIGIEAALQAQRAGYPVRLLERGRIAANVRSWGHVRLFSPFGMNRSEAGLDALRRHGVRPPDDQAYLTGADYAEGYLAPLAACAELDGRVETDARVVSVGRDGLTKSDRIGGPRRERPFRLLVEREGVEEILHADVVLDCSGTYGHANWLGNGNVPAPGERGLAGEIRYTLDDIAGSARSRYENRRVLVVGGGYSAATALEALRALPGTSVVWACRASGDAPLAEIEDDPLPERSRLAARANELARGAEPAVEFLGGAVVERLAREPDGIEVTFGTPNGTRQRRVDRVLAHVGYSPDRALYRELQFHECWATLGPMKLAAGLLAAGGGDCLAREPLGPDSLRNPEPDFYVLGAKSYGKNSSFLIRLGLQQLAEVFTLVDATRRSA